MISRITHVHWRSRVRIHARANVHTTLHIQHWRPNGWTVRDPNWYKHSLGQSAQVMGVGVGIARAARAIMAAQSSRASSKRENERETREYMNGTWRCSWREHGARVYGTRISWSVEQQN
jgi:hypothetical protein